MRRESSAASSLDWLYPRARSALFCHGNEGEGVAIGKFALQKGRKIFGQCMDEVPFAPLETQDERRSAVLMQIAGARLFDGERLFLAFEADALFPDAAAAEGTAPLDLGKFGAADLADALILKDFTPAQIAGIVVRRIAGIEPLGKAQKKFPDAHVSPRIPYYNRRDGVCQEGILRGRSDETDQQSKSSPPAGALPSEDKRKKHLV